MIRKDKSDPVRLQLQNWDPAAEETLADADRLRLRAAVLAESATTAELVQRRVSRWEPGSWGVSRLALAAAFLAGVGLLAVVLMNGSPAPDPKSESMVAILEVADPRLETSRSSVTAERELLVLPDSAPAISPTTPTLGERPVFAALPRRQRRVQIQSRGGTRIYWTLDPQFEEISTSSVGF